MEKNTCNLIKDLVGAGLTQSDIAKEIGVTQGTISQVLSGGGKRDLKFTTGYRLLRLHQQRVKGAAHA